MAVCYYLIENKNVTDKMMEDSMKSLGVNLNPTLDDVFEYDRNCRHIMDTSTTPDTMYHIMKFKHDFFSSMVGLTPYTLAEMKTELADAKWLVSV